MRCNSASDLAGEAFYGIAVFMCDLLLRHAVVWSLTLTYATTSVTSLRVMTQ